MTEAFWWYLLAGFFIGFSVSTLWEWLYFRRRRMAIRDRRVAELEATLRTYAAAASAPATSAAATEDWGEPQFESPHVYLETENPTPPPDDQPETPPPSSMQSPRAPVFVVAGAPMNAAPENQLNTAAEIEQTPPVIPFRSVAVSSSAMAASAHPQPADLPPPSARMKPVEAAAIIGATAYANGHAGQHRAESSQIAATEHVDQSPITSRDLDVLAASINDLITTLNKATAETKNATTAEQPPLITPHRQSDATPPMGRIERMLVRLVQTMARFVRQVRLIVAGEETPTPGYGAPRLAADDLTRIDGLTPEHVTRLRVAGVTTFERLAALSPDELRLLTLMPGGAAVDVERWRAQAADFAVSSPERAQP